MKKHYSIFLLTLACLFAFFFTACKQPKLPNEYEIWGEVADSKILLHIDLIPDECIDYCAEMIDANGFEIWMSDISADSLKLVETISFTDLHEIKNLTNGKSYFIEVKPTFKEFEKGTTKTIRCAPNVLNNATLHTPEVSIPFSIVLNQQNWHNNLNYFSYFVDSSVFQNGNRFFNVWDVTTAETKTISQNKIYGSDWNKATEELVFIEGNSLCIYDATTQTKKSILTEYGEKYKNPVWFVDNQNILFLNKNTAYRCRKDGSNLTATNLTTSDFSGGIFPHATNEEFYMCSPMIANKNRNVVFRWNINTNQRDTVCTTFGYYPLNIVAVSPDGNKLVIQSEMSGKMAIWIYDIPTQSWYQTILSNVTAGAKFSPDGTELLFFLYRSYNKVYKLYSLKIS